jgi:hypothetical protein
MKYETAGDPMTGLCWTRKTTEKISEELDRVGIKVSRTTVAKILKNLNYSLKVNSKKISNGGVPLTLEQRQDRNEQFMYISECRKEFEERGLPIISVDGKKKELIGNFKNPGTRMRKDPDLTYDHDFITYALGKALPFGIFDIGLLEGYIYVGQSNWNKDEKKFTSSETPRFAADNIARWWADYGASRYPGADEVLILADSGGSNSCRSRVWKYKIYKLLCEKYGLKVTVAHYPTGASKWNPIEHRLFSELSKNWKGAPLISFETVLKYARTTKTKTGLNVKARLVTKKYKIGETICVSDYDKMNLKPHDVHPRWNYTLSPVG